MSLTPVGSTARWIAAGRAIETEWTSPLFSDPFARDLAGDEGFAMLLAMRGPDRIGDTTTPDPYFSIRTRFFDDGLIAAVRDGAIRQVLILAAGMDSRAFRLEWPPGVVLYEIDRDDVFAYKEPIVQRLNGQPRCDRRIVRADLTGSWTSTLAEAGFDPSRPSAILVEGLLYYLDEASATRLLSSIDALAAPGSWMGMDMVNTDVLRSPYMSVYVQKLREFGCPWMFGVSDPESLLAEHGWHGTIVLPGEPDANYGRWAYPVVPRTVPGMPRIYLGRATRMTAEEKAARHAVVASQKEEVVEKEPAAPARVYEAISEPDLVGAFGCPDGKGPFPAVLALGGSDGGVPTYFLDLLVPEGFAGLALAYFGAAGTQPALVEVPLERIERGLRWLAGHPKVKTHDGRVALVGVSKGGELALLIAATFPDLVGPVVAYTPSSVAWAGIDFTQPSGTRRSSWSYKGAPVPWLPYPEGIVPTFSSRGLVGRPIYERGIENTSAVERAAIPVERATGPLLLVSGGDDNMWPAARMCEMVVERMRQHGRANAVGHLNYPAAGHSLFPPKAPSGAPPPMPFDLGGSRDADRAAHAAAWPQIVAHLEQGRRPASSR
ncbi:MAG TPA: SAM-dependent methyltransferase [Vicinamibacterales bacterium]